VARHTLTLTSGDRSYTVAIDGQRVRVDGDELSIAPGGHGEFLIAGPPDVAAWAVADGDTRWVFLDGRTFVLEVSRQAAGRRRGRAHHSSLTAPMPATVRRIEVAAGDRVERGDTLIILEAMKMELPVKAGTAGTVRAVHCREGELVQPGAELIEIDDLAEAGATAT
jgi:biotin carboxyl carrier protein